MKKIIAFISSDKIPEYQEFWQRYHIDIEQRPPLNTYEHYEIFDILREVNVDDDILTVLTEATSVIDNTLITQVWFIDNGEEHYYQTDPIPITYDANRPSLGLGWDNHVLLPNGYSCYEMSKKGQKNIGRQSVFSLLAERFCHTDYKKWNFIYARWNDSVMHDNIIPKVLEMNPFFSNDAMHKHWLYPLFQRALHRAEFVRTGNTRPLRNYWLPGLNAGLPSVPKSDLFHETTFLVHDMCHFIFPDVVYNGDPQTLQHYHIARMISEAITMTFADMWFVDVIRPQFNYDYTQRGIYPIFQEIITHHPDITPYELAWANTQYAVLGDTSEYAKYLDINGVAWKNFDKKFSRFFIEDHHWTHHNSQSMASNSDAYQRFVRDTKSHIERLELTLSKNICDVKTIFDDMWTRYIMNATSTIKLTPKDHYWLGQSFLFFNYPSSHKDAFFNAWDDADEKAMQQCYMDTLDELHHALYINEDERYHYRSIYPFFKPHYVFYEQKSTEILKDVANLYLCIS